MTFVQVIDFKASDLDAIRRVNDEWADATDGKRTAKRLVLGTYRDDPERVCQIVFFDSHDEAMRNSELPETQQFAEKLRDMTDGEPQFFDLDVVEERTL